MKNRKERGEPGKIHHVRNITGRENSPMLYCTLSVVKALWLTERTRRHYATLPGSMASCGEGTQTSTFKNHANLLAYLANWPLYTGEWLSRNTKTRVCSSLLSTYFSRKKKRAPTTTWLRLLSIMQLCV